VSDVMAALAPGAPVIHPGSLESNLLERLLPDWSIPLGAVYWVTPLEGPLPKRVEVLGEYLIEKLARGRIAENQGSGVGAGASEQKRRK